MATTAAWKKVLLFFCIVLSLLYLFTSPVFDSPPLPSPENDTPQTKIPWVISVPLNKPDYVAMAGVALVTSKKYSVLEPHVLISHTNFSPTHPFVLWLAQQNIPFHVYVPVMTNEILELQKQNKVTESWVEIALGGVFGRLDAPRVYREWGGRDKYVLYTDVDVMWVHDPSSLLTLSIEEPAVLAIGPEKQKGTKMNSGVLWMNVDRWLASSKGFYEYCSSRHWQGNAWDQGLLLDYFNPHRSIVLPDKFNYKLYWGNQPGADRPVMIHFHGPKPKVCLDGCGSIECTPPHLRGYVDILEHTRAHPGLCLQTLEEFEKIYNRFQCPGDEEFVRYEDLEHLGPFPTGVVRPC